MSPGLSITAQVTLTAGTMYAAVFRGEDGRDVELTPSLHENAAAATQHYVARARAHYATPEWLTGSGVDKRTARKLGLTVRLRAPGAGRPRKPKGARSVPLTFWFTPKEAEGVQAAAKESGRPLGKEVAHRFGLTG